MLQCLELQFQMEIFVLAVKRNKHDHSSNGSHDLLTKILRILVEVW